MPTGILTDLGRRTPADFAATAAPAPTAAKAAAQSAAQTATQTGAKTAVQTATTALTSADASPRPSAAVALATLAAGVAEEARTAGSVLTDLGPATDDGPATGSPAPAALGEAPTLADVAALAGVSQATASRVLNGSARVSDDARGQVEDAMARLGYVRRRATHTRDVRSGSVAAIVTESSARFFSDPFFARLLRGASRTLSAAGLQLAFLAVHEQNEYAAAERYLRCGGIDGVLLISAHGRDRLLPALKAAAIPTVVCGRPLVPGDASYVDTDNVGGARSAVGHLVAEGRRRVATIAGPRDMTSAIDRLAGYREILDGAGLAPLVGYGDFSLASGEHAMTRLLERRPDLDSVFVASDLMAAGALRALRRAGRRVPADVAVVGFDDDPLAQHTLPPLTTVRQPVEEQGATMAMRVMSLMESDSQTPARDELPTSLVRRESA